MKLVELVTKVIREQQGCFFDDIARAAIAAMRDYLVACGCDTGSAIHQIDAALKEDT